jgi:uncharacterized membrane protein YvbJ
MFCQNCGNELRQGLKYCNRCGGRVNDEVEKHAGNESNSIVQSLAIAIGWIGVAGIVALAILIGNVLRRDPIPGKAIILLFLLSALVFGIIFLIVQQISSLTGKSVRSQFNDFRQVPESLPKAEPVRLDAPREPVTSVTENTTRNFAEAFVKKANNQS